MKKLKNFGLLALVAVMMTVAIGCSHGSSSSGGEIGGSTETPNNPNNPDDAGSGSEDGTGSDRYKYTYRWNFQNVEDMSSFGYIYRELYPDSVSGINDKKITLKLDGQFQKIDHNKSVKEGSKFSITATKGMIEPSSSKYVYIDLQGPFKVSMNATSNSGSDQNDRYAHILVAGKEYCNESERKKNLLPALGTTVVAEYEGTDSVRVYLGGTNNNTIIFDIVIETDVIQKEIKNDIEITVEPEKIKLMAGESASVKVFFKTSVREFETYYEHIKNYLEWPYDLDIAYVEYCDDNKEDFFILKITARDGVSGSTTLDIAAPKYEVKSVCEIEVYEGNVPVTGVQISPSEISLYPNETYQLSANIQPDNATNKGVFWYSVNESVASVDENGFITTHSVGTAKIYVRTNDGGYSAYCTVTVKPTTANYTIKYFYQNIDDEEYTENESERETREGNVGSITNVEAGSVEGFTLLSIGQVTIYEDCENIVNVYYSRNTIKYYFTYGNSETYSDTNYEESWYYNNYWCYGKTIFGKYGAPVTPPTPTRIGFTFSQWDKTVDDVFAGVENRYTASWEANTDTPYKVEHWQENIDDNEYTLVETESLTGTTLEYTQAVAKTYEGFSESVVSQSKIAGSGSTVVKIKYKRKNITLTFNPASGKIDGSTVTKNISGKYGAIVTPPTNVTRSGYTFDDWDSEVQTVFTEDATYTAKWKPNNLKITVTLPPAQTDISNLVYEIDGSALTLTAETGHDTYAWFIDTVKQSGSSASLELDTTSWDAGLHSVMVIVDGKYSSTATVEIVK